MSTPISPTRLDLERIAPALTRVVSDLLALPARIARERVFEPDDAAALSRLRALSLPAQGRDFAEVVDEMLDEIYPRRARMNHPRCFAFIPTPASPLSWIGEMLTAAHNPFAGSWLQSAGPSVIERTLIEWLCARLGLPPTAGGLFVSGGSMANLTALTVARDRKLTPDRRAAGTVYVSEQTHSSVRKGLAIIGILAERIRIVPVDADYRMDVTRLRESLDADRAAGLTPFAVVASAGTTNTGSIDALGAIADLCRDYGAWMHVDGAFGASVALSSSADLLTGIARADSVSWDAHKWLFQTYGCGTLLVRDRRDLMGSFHTRPEYLRDAVADEDSFNFWDLGPELTRPARALKLWLSLQVLGLDAIRAAIDHGLRLAHWAEQAVRAHADWEVTSPARLAIVTFRFAPAGHDEATLDAINADISRAMMADGFAGVLTTRLRGRTVLRICALHPDATEDDMRQTIARLDAFARAAAAARTERAAVAVP